MNYIGGEGFLEVVAREDLCEIIVENMTKFGGGESIVYTALWRDSEEGFNKTQKNLRSRMGFLNRMCHGKKCEQPTQNVGEELRAKNSSIFEVPLGEGR
jgi:hypothetical protein